MGLNGKERCAPAKPLPCVAEHVPVPCPVVAGVGEICCMAELDSPPQQKWTRAVAASGTGAEVEWTEELFL